MQSGELQFVSPAAVRNADHSLGPAGNTFVALASTHHCGLSATDIHAHGVELASVPVVALYAPPALSPPVITAIPPPADVDTSFCNVTLDKLAFVGAENWPLELAWLYAQIATTRSSCCSVVVPAMLGAVVPVLLVPETLTSYGVLSAEHPLNRTMYATWLSVLDATTGENGLELDARAQNTASDAPLP